ncbi:MAG: hypothetical protein CSA72_00295 [Rhodobacterales bacterium]|nr:MAG: hypothetical protein CSA72_00295 [Rhodobacterales bacterium]
MRYCFISQTTRIQNPILDPSVRYRCYHPAAELRAQGHSCSVASAHQFTRAPDFDADVYVFHRPSIGMPGIARVIETLRDKGKILIADYDDLIFGGPEVAGLSSQARTGNIPLERVERAFQINLDSLRLFDRVTVSTTPLKEEVAGHLPQARVHVLANFLPRDLLAFHRREETWRHPRSDNRVGYFSGTLSHNRDFEIVSDLLLDLLRDDPAFSLMLVGPLEVPEDFAVLPNAGRHRVVDYSHLAHLMTGFNTVIAPLEDSRFTRCKSRVKYLESCLTGCRLVASPIPDMIAAGMSAEDLPDSPEAWRAALTRRPDPEQLAAQARPRFEQLGEMIPALYDPILS